MRSCFFFLVLLFGFSCTASAQIAAIGDLNGDGRPDVVVGNGSQNTVSIFINNGNGSLSATLFPGVSGAVTGVALADFNMDGHLDILVWEQPGLELLLGDGTGHFAPAVSVPTAGLSVDQLPVVADFNGDGIPDIAFSGAFLFGDGHGGFSAPAFRSIALEGAGLQVFLFDANHDGSPDLVATGSIPPLFTKVCYVAVNNGDGTFKTTALSEAIFGGGSECAPTPDLNGDGNADVVSQFSYFFEDGQGGLLYGQPRLFGFQPKIADGIAVDFDHNGTTDFLQARAQAGLVYFPGNGRGGFGDPITLSSSQDEILAVGDLNGDGLPDIVLQDPFTKAVSFFINNVIAPVSVATASSTTLAASAATGSTAAPVTLVATIGSLNAGSPSAAGTVTFSEGLTTLGSAPVNIYGIAALDFTFSSGLHNISAAFSGALDPSTNTLFAPSASTSSVAVAVNPGAPPGAVPNVSLTTSVNPARLLNPVTFASAVTASAPSANSPAGSLLFKADGNVIGFANPESVQLIENFPTAGLHNIQAVYGGDANFPPATSSTLVEDIRAFNAARTATTTQLTLTPLNPGVTLHASLAGVANPPGQFVYRINGAFLAFSGTFDPGFAPKLQGTYTISAEYSGDAARLPSSTSTTFIVGNPAGDFTLGSTPSNATIKAGQSATFTISVNPVNGLNSSVSFACSGLPAASSCTFSPATLNMNGGLISTTLTINTTASQSAKVPVARLRAGTFAWTLGIVFGLLFVGKMQSGEKAKFYWIALGSLVLMLLIVSCGGGGSTATSGPTPTPTPAPGNGTPSGQSTITVTATSATTHNVQLFVTVTP
ncbi:MAG TPA: FG-GAP-like repeat-containing protein [Candidatus Angelobacter sp.]